MTPRDGHAIWSNLCRNGRAWTRRPLLVLLALVLALGGVRADEAATTRAAANARQATRALVESRRVMHAWLARRDPTSGLLPHRGVFQGSRPDPSWVVANTAADLYPFMVMAARLTEPATYHGAMLDILRQETLLTTRIGRLSDDVQGGAKGFVRPALDMDAVIFGSSEYMKDGLVPLTELFGETPWYHRMEGIATDIVRLAPYRTSRGTLPAQTTEINGNMLQVLSRLYFRTGNPAYRDQVLAIADFYFLDMLPTTRYLPADRWDTVTRRPLTTRFVLSDHGNEIVGGLSEAYVLAMRARPDKAEQYRPAFVQMIDRLLEVGRTPDGLWHHDIDIVSGQPLTPRHAHCWGYMFNAVYTAYMTTGEPRFRDAVRRAIATVAQTPTYLFDETPPVAWWSANSYSDAIESALVLMNRLPDEALAAQIDIAAAKMLDRIRPDGIVEDWHGDGNYIRTALMYALWKTQGARLEPWAPTVHVGASRTGSDAAFSVQADQPWTGVLRLDHPRHRDHLHLPMNYPRLNEWPEWFTVEHDRRYQVQVGSAPPVARLGAELVQGIALTLKAGELVSIVVSDGGPPPYAR